MATSSTALQHFLRGAVACLLTANCFAVAVLASDADVPPAADQGARTITVIRSADGRTEQVDPNTDQGRAAIEQAERNGGTLTTVTVPPPSSTSTSLLQGPATTLAAEAGADDPVEDVNQKAGEVIDDTQTTVDSIIDQGQTTVTSILGDGPAGPIVDHTQTTLKNTVDEVQHTATTIVGAVHDPVGTVGGVVGGL